MIIEIEKPNNLKFHGATYSQAQYYFNDITKQYFWFLKGKTDSFNEKIFFDLESGQVHNLNGYAHTSFYVHVFFIFGHYYYAIDFAEKTNHKVCLNCKKFCKQECFVLNDDIIV